MSKSASILVASTLAVIGANSLADGARNRTSPRQKPATVIAVLGPIVAVPAGTFVKASAVCPKGFYVTGGGAYSGAITEIASSPTKDLRGWFVDGMNNDPLHRTFQHRADAVCVEGTPSLSARMAAADQARLVRQAELDFASRHPTSSGRRP